MHAIKFLLLFHAQNALEHHACVKNQKFLADHADNYLALAIKFNNQYAKFASNWHHFAAAQNKYI